MQLEIQHVEVHVSSVEKAKAFYVDKLGLEILDEMPELNLLALKAGNVRISIFGGYEPNPNPTAKQTGMHLIFRTNNLTETIGELKSKGVVFKGDVFEAPGFIRDIATTDPDGNVIEFAEYLRDPLKPNPVRLQEAE
jgi:catechol 2,3-dioxygenase-like lactoylglutathione lyase family enzyme